MKHKALIANSINEVSGEIAKYDVIIIDEGQFFPDIELVDLIANERVVIVACLDGDYLRKPFTNIANLIPKCEIVTKLSAICSCGLEAHYTHRTVHNDD